MQAVENCAPAGERTAGVSRREGGDAYEGAFMDALGCSACAGVIHDVNG